MRVGGWLAALGLLLVAPVTGRAQPVAVPDTWGGDLLSRPRLTGSWGGLRDEMGKKGIVLDLDFILTPQAVATGGINTGAHFWGNSEYTLNVDTQKAGLWPGGFLKVVGMSAFGDNILADTGALVPVNTALLLPSTEPSSALVNATFTQFLSPKFGSRQARYSWSTGRTVSSPATSGPSSRTRRSPSRWPAPSSRSPRTAVVSSAYRGSTSCWRRRRSTPTGLPRTTTSPRRSGTASWSSAARFSRSTRSAWSVTRISMSCGATRNACRSSRILG